MSYLPLRIAVASTDGDTVDQHLGRARQFLIFETSAAGPFLVDRRCLPQRRGGCGQHPQHLAGILHRIEDCAVVVASQAGPGLHDQLAGAGIHVLISDQKVDFVLDRIARSHLAGNLPRKERES